MAEAVETDHISDVAINKAYTEGFDSYPSRRRSQNPYSHSWDQKILHQAWLTGWEDALETPTSLTEIGF